MTSPEVDAISRDTVIVIPTGSLEQHGRHLPLFTDSLIVTAVCQAVDDRISSEILVTPCLWLGASAHHIAFPGTMTASMDSYIGSLISCVESLHRHGFHRFFVVNGHGGNTDPNGVALRTLKERHKNITVGHSGYFSFIDENLYSQMVGPVKGIRHACEAETSLMLHLHPNSVHMDRAVDDGLECDVTGVIGTFDEITENGVLGFATKARAELGKVLFESAVEGLASHLSRFRKGIIWKGIAPS